MAAPFLALIADAASAEADLDGAVRSSPKPRRCLRRLPRVERVESEGEIGPDLDEFKPTVDQVRAAVTSEIGIMPAFSETLTKEEIETVSKYVAQVTGGSENAAGSEAAT